MIPVLQRLLPGLDYAPVSRDWEMADFQHRPHSWSRARRFVVARQCLAGDEKQPTLFALGRYVYRAWVTNLSLTPLGVWHFYDARAALKPGIRELLEDYALRKIPTRSFQANALFLEIIRLAYNLVTAFQRLCLQESWQCLTLSKLRYKLFLLPGELTRPQNRPVLSLRESSMLQLWPTISNGYQETPASDILKRHFHAGFRLYDTSVPGNGNQWAPLRYRSAAQGQAGSDRVSEDTLV